MSKYSLKKKEPQISAENAFNQVMELIEWYDIDIDAFEGDQEKAIEQSIEKVERAIMNGDIEININEDGELKVTQHLKRRSKKSTVSSLVYAEITGKDKAAMSADASEHKKITQLLGSACESQGGHVAVEQMKSYDRKIAEALAILFL